MGKLYVAFFTSIIGFCGIVSWMIIDNQVPLKSLLLISVSFLTIFIIGQLMARRSLSLKKRLDSQLENVFEMVPAIIYRCDCNANWTMTFISNQVEMVTGYPSQDFINDEVRSFASIIFSEDCEKVERVIEQAVTERRTYEINYRIVDKARRIRYVYEVGRGVYDEDGKINKLDGVILDISERKLLEQKMDREKSKVIHASKLANFGYMSSSLLARIKGPLLILQDSFNFIKEKTLHGFDSDSSSELFEVLEQSGFILENMSKEIEMVYSLNESSHSDKREKYQIKKIISEGLFLLSEHLKELEVSLIGDEDVYAICNFYEIQQAILNLVLNSKKALKAKSSKWIEISFKYEKDCVVIAVTDAGSGIKNNIANSMFAPFFTTNSSGEGAGLGLSTAMDIAHRHGGNLELDKNSKNTKFVFKIKSGL